MCRPRLAHFPPQPLHQPKHSCAGCVWGGRRKSHLPLRHQVGRPSGICEEVGRGSLALLVLQKGREGQMPLLEGAPWDPGEGGLHCA